MNRTELSGLQTFLAIVQNGSLRAAARDLGVNPPAVSHQLKAFERQLGVALFTRSTRSVSLTDAGRALLERGRHVIGGLEEALETARAVGQARSGKLKVTLPSRAWQMIVAPRLAEFQLAYPEIELELSINEALVDIVANGFHAGIRLGDHLQNDMIAVRLTGQQKGATLAAPAYLATRSAVRHPRDLLYHNCIRHREISLGRLTPWRFSGSDGEFTVAVEGSLILDDLRTVVDAVERGLGIGWSLRDAVADKLASGDLVELLPDFALTRPAFFLYFPRDLAKLQILRLFVAHFRPEKGSKAA